MGALPASAETNRTRIVVADPDAYNPTPATSVVEGKVERGPDGLFVRLPEPLSAQGYTFDKVFLDVPFGREGAYEAAVGQVRCYKGEAQVFPGINPWEARLSLEVDAPAAAQSTPPGVFPIF